MSCNHRIDPECKEQDGPVSYRGAGNHPLRKKGARFTPEYTRFDPAFESLRGISVMMPEPIKERAAAPMPPAAPPSNARASAPVE